MPKHSHGETLMASGYSGWESNTTNGYGIHFSFDKQSYGINYSGSGSSYKGASVSTYTTTANTGSSQPHNNLPPYLVVCILKNAEPRRLLYHQ